MSDIPVFFFSLRLFSFILVSSYGCLISDARRTLCLIFLLSSFFLVFSFLSCPFLLSIVYFSLLSLCVMSLIHFDFLLFVSFVSCSCVIYLYFLVLLCFVLYECFVPCFVSFCFVSSPLFVRFLSLLFPLFTRLAL